MANVEEEKMRYHLSKVGKDGLTKAIPAVMFCADKGGTGKSTNAITYAFELVKRTGLKVGFVDADIDSPNVPEMLGLQGPMRIRRDRLLEPIEFRGIKFASAGLFTTDRVFSTTMAGRSIQQIVYGLIRGVNWVDREMLVVDCPAGTGDEFIATLKSIGEENNLGAFVIVNPVNQTDLTRIVNLSLFNDYRILGVIENMKGVVSDHGKPFVCSCGCGRVFDLYSVPNGIKSVQEICKENEVPYLGGIPMVDGYPTQVMKKNPFLPEFVLGPINAAIQTTMDVYRVVQSKEMTRDRESEIAKLLQRRVTA